MKYASTDLKREHKGILLGLRILEVMSKSAQAGKTIDMRDISGMVEFLKLFADEYHHGKEEQLLFPAMEKAGIKNDNGPIGELLYEHILGRNYILGMAKSISSGVLEEAVFIPAANDYVALMRAHIQKENTRLFPQGNKMIPADEQKSLLRQFGEFEEEVMGEGTHERLHQLLNKLEAEYLQ